MTANTFAARARATSRYRLSFTHLLRSEWIKLTTVRSTWWTLGTTAAVSVGISILVASVATVDEQFPTVNVILAPMQFTMLVAGIMGVIVVTGEYSTGTIRSTLTAEPRRGGVVASKAVVVGALIGVAMVVTYAVAIGATAPFLSEGINWSDPIQSTLPLLLGVFSMVVVAQIGLGFGFMLRSSVGAIALIVGILFVLPTALTLLAIPGSSWDWIAMLPRYMPMTAAVMASTPGEEALVVPVLTLAAWGVAALLGGWAVLRGRDA